jgi:DNA-binding transcriptional MocR family regulator
MTIWKPQQLDPNKPLYLAIAQALADDIQSRNLAPGDRLPPQRDLADEIGVTLGTVTRAYEEARKKGLIKGETGRGTFVARQLPEPKPLRINADHPPGHIDLTCAYPIYGVDPELAPALRTLADNPDVQSLMCYQPSEGLHRHRAAGARWLKGMGLPDITPDNVIVTNGAQHANTAIFGLLAGPGDTILTEALTFPNIKSVAALMHLNLEPVAMDDNGLIPEAFEMACRNGRVRALYCIPTLHNPTTAIMPESRKQKIAAIARDHDVAIVEDENYRLLQPDAPPLIASFAPERTFLVGGISKALAAGLRIAYVACPPKFYKRLLYNVAATTIMATPLSAEIAAMWIEDGTAEISIERRRKDASARYETARRILAPFSCKMREYCYYAWLELPDFWRASQFAAELYRRGISVTPADAFTVGYAPVPNAVRIVLSAARDQETLIAALNRVAETLSDPPAGGTCLV